ncbi:glycosyltransferase [Companilactobacillus huachuanensis]|uniref:Glycosyltransferase n=1 Tax=Companilactobacillus huachuanensis TaxID=2559914 RepID=A0ABW1RQ23_9LACO|nr:glycosyltransferase [Companilactobacillus huachuanensis]
MNILYCGDANIKDGLLISILSLLKNSNSELHVYVLTARIKTPEKVYQPIPNQAIAYLEKIMKEKNVNNSIIKIDITILFESNVPEANLKTIFTPCCMLRLYADEVSALPDKILYLDTDVICRKNFRDFYDQDLSNYELAGVLDQYGKWFFHRSLIRFDYLNSGILLLNLKLIRETGLFKKCRKRCHSKKMFMPDQSSINKLVVSKIKCPAKFNEQGKLKVDTIFQHFTTNIRFFPWIHTLTVKPWQVEQMHQTLGLHEYDQILTKYKKIKINL